MHRHLQLYFAALLRLPRTMSKEEKLVRVDAVITALGLDKCKNTIIGKKEKYHDLLSRPYVPVTSQVLQSRIYQNRSTHQRVKSVSLQ